jgi:hypothetical protein
MTMSWHLRGYARETGRLSKDFHIQPDLLPIVRDVLPDTDEDPVLIEPHELSPSRADRLADAIGLVVQPDLFDYFIEAEEDWRVVAAIRASHLEAA